MGFIIIWAKEDGSTVYISSTFGHAIEYNSGTQNEVIDLKNDNEVIASTPQHLKYPFFVDSSK